MIRVTFNHKVLEFEGSMTTGQLLKKMNLLPEVVLVAKNGEIVTEDEFLRPEDEVEIIRAISGGADPASLPRSNSVPGPIPDGARVSYRIPIKDWPDSDQPREKLIQMGPDSLNDAELLAILLRTGVKGLSAVDLARQVLKDVGGWAVLARSDAADYQGVKGLGPAKIAQILAALEIGRRAAHAPKPDELYIRGSGDVFQLVSPKLRDLKKEVLDVLFLNSRNHVLAQERLSRGTVNRSSVFAREIVERALRRGAAALILIHNHPSGDPAPSAEDERVTQEMVWAGEILNLCVLDHVIIGGNRHFSFADEGKIEAMRSKARDKRK